MAGDDARIILNTLRAATPWDVYMDAVSLTKLSMTVNFLALVAVLVMAIVRRSSGGKRSPVLDLLGVFGLVVGLTGAAYCGLNSWIAAQYAHVSNVYVVLPSIIEAAYAFLAGVLVWLVAGFGNSGARRG